MNFAQFRSNNLFISSNLELLDNGFVCARKSDLVMVLMHFFCKITTGFSTVLKAEPHMILQYDIYSSTRDI